MSFEFLSPDAAAGSDQFDPVARSPMERQARAAGARLEVRDGWAVGVAYGSAEQDAELCRTTVGWVDVSHLGKLELQAAPADVQAIVAHAGGGAAGPLELGRAVRAAGAWWCPLTPGRALVLSDPGLVAGLRERLLEGAGAAAQPASVIDVTTGFAALTLVGPQAREVFARFCAIDLRPQVTPVAGLRPGSIGRQPGIVLREADDRFLFLFGWAVAGYIWTVVEDAGRHLGGGPVGVDALAALPGPLEEVPSHA